MIRRLASRDVVLPLVCGMGLALAYPRAGIALFAWIAPVPWLARTVAVRSPRGIGIGFLFGLGFFGLLLNWVHGVMDHFTSLPLFLTLPIWLLLVGYLALYPAVFGGLVSALARRGAGPALALAPALWVGLEYVRGRLLGGFPWGTAGYARAGGLALLQSASIGGVALVSLLLASSWAALTVLLLAARDRNAIATAGHAASGEGAGSKRSAVVHPSRAAVVSAFATLAVVGLAIVLGGLRLLAHPPVPDQRIFGDLSRTGGWLPAGSSSVGGGPDRLPDPAPGPPGAPYVVALVQGGYGSDFEYQDGPRILRDYLDLSRRAASAAAPALIVWPESNTPYQPDHDEAYRKVLSDLSRETGALLLLGGVGGDAASGLTNSAWLFGADGLIDRYDKRRLVQYGEYVPLKGIFPFVRKFVPEAGDFRPGDRPGIVDARGRRLGIAICYEILFPDEILAQARGGASLLVNITNDSWFPGGGPWQHAEFVPLRALESGRWIARAASTGRTVLVDPQGRMRAAGPLGGPAVLVAAIPALPATGLLRETLFLRWGEWVGKGCATLTAFALAFLFIGNNIDRRRQGKWPQRRRRKTGR